MYQLDGFLKMLAIILIFNFVFWLLSGNFYGCFITLILFVLDKTEKLPPEWRRER
jgi:hypothetical protein